MNKFSRKRLDDKTFSHVERCYLPMQKTLEKLGLNSFLKIAYCSLVLTIMAAHVIAQAEAMPSNIDSKKEQEILDNNYITDNISFLDYAEKQDGFWLLFPEIEKHLVKNVIVFLHGYGGYNPMIYGSWLKHLSKQGNIVIYPRYQKTLYVPKTKKFVKNAVYGLKQALEELDKMGFDAKLWESLDYAVHSYGGVISTNMAMNYELYEIPPARNMLLCSPGSGPFNGGVLKSYSKLPSNINLVVITSENDLTVGDKFGKLVFNSAVNTPRRVYLKQRSSRDDDLRITAGHNECYALDRDFDTGVRNYTAKKALRISKTDLLDKNGYWKLMDDLLEFGESNEIFLNSMKEWDISSKEVELEPIGITHPNSKETAEKIQIEGNKF